MAPSDTAFDLKLKLSRTGKLLLAIVAATFLLRSCHLVNHLGSPLAHPEEVLESTDNAAFSVWAKRIAEGDSGASSRTSRS